jgi:hypothetical protein
LPFSGGPRNCLGRKCFFSLLFVTVIFLKANTFATEQFALVEAGYFIVKLLQRFDVLENATDGPDLGTNPRMNQTLTFLPYRWCLAPA